MKKKWTVGKTLGVLAGTASVALATGAVLAWNRKSHDEKAEVLSGACDKVWRKADNISDKASEFRSDTLRNCADVLSHMMLGVSELLLCLADRVQGKHGEPWDTVNEAESAGVEPEDAGVEVK